MPKCRMPEEPQVNQMHKRILNKSKGKQDPDPKPGKRNPRGSRDLNHTIAPPHLSNHHSSSATNSTFGVKEE